MGITDYLSATDVLLDLAAPNKAAVIDLIAGRAAGLLDRPEPEIVEALRARERLGSTGLGRGVALPHARIEGDAQPVAMFVRTTRPLDFEARDEQPVDLVIAVLWPSKASEGFLPLLSETCRSLRDPQRLRRLRAAVLPEDILAVLAESQSRDP